MKINVFQNTHHDQQYKFDFIFEAISILFHINKIK